MGNETSIAQSKPKKKKKTSTKKKQNKPSKTSSISSVVTVVDNVPFRRQTVLKIKNKCNSLGLPTDGSTDDMIERILNDKRFRHEISQNQCSTIKTCPSIQLITYYLKIHHESLKQKAIEKHSGLEAVPVLSDAFNHILSHHLGDNKPIYKTRKEYETIAQYIANSVPSCNLKNCKKHQRNNRQRESTSIQNFDENGEYFIELMDTIHCFLLHSFDVGLRVNTSDLNKIYHQTDQTDEKKTEAFKEILTSDGNDNIDDISNKDIVMNKLSGARSNFNRQNKKFVTNVEVKTDVPTHIFSFGYRYNYWDKNNANYVCAKYSSSKQEILNNNIFKVDVKKYNSIQSKATKKSQTSIAKSTVAIYPYSSSVYDIKR
eukprot:271196_1